MENIEGGLIPLQSNTKMDNEDCFERGIPNGTCDTNGHYLCHWCIHRNPYNSCDGRYPFVGSDGAWTTEEEELSRNGFFEKLQEMQKKRVLYRQEEKEQLSDLALRHKFLQSLRKK